MKHPENLHRDYIPVRISTHVKSNTVQGIIVSMEFYKVNNLTRLQKFIMAFGIYKSRDIYFWLPYKNVVEASMKYGVIGPKSRFPYANQWFQVRETHNIYSQGLDTYRALDKYTKEIRTSIPFDTKELLILTRKQVIKMLDEFVFAKKQQQRK